MRSVPQGISKGHSQPAEIFKGAGAKVAQSHCDGLSHVPHCSGVELAEMLRHDERYMMIPVVFLSTEKTFEIPTTGGQRVPAMTSS